ncbi:hypothetical protein V6N13_006053 [Hibiscus sabdariffa]
MQHEWTFTPITSPVSFFSPPCVKGCGLSARSPESILRITAKSFPNTPSIFRKRRMGAQSLTLPIKIGKMNEETIKGRIRFSSEEKRTEDGLEQVQLPDGSTSKSPACQDDNNIVPNCTTFNTSPPYRLGTKRASLFKSAERQLEFTFAKERLEDDAKSSGLFEDCLHASKMTVSYGLKL